MIELEKKIRELVGDNNYYIPTAILFAGFALELSKLIYSTFEELKKGNEKND